MLLTTPFLAGSAATVLGGDLLPMDRMNARSALVAAVGRKEADTFALLVAGCDFSACTSVVTRHATFSKNLSRESEKIERRLDVLCSGRRESQWHCGAPKMFASFSQEDRLYDFQIDSRVSDERIKSIIRYMRSPCFATAVSTYSGRGAIPHWAVGARILAVESVGGEFRVSVGDAYSGLRISLAEASDEESCRYGISKYTGWVV